VVLGPWAAVGRVQHRVGGAWSGLDCPNCKRPMTCIIELDLRDPLLLPLRARSYGDERIPMLYCWTCRVPYEELRYAYSAAGAKVVRYGVGGGDEGFPYEGYPKVHGIIWAELGGEVHGEIEWGDNVVVIEGCSRGLRSGREIYLGSEKYCSCGDRMDPIMLFWDPNNSSVDFCGNHGVAHEFYWCATCGVVAAEHHVD